MEEIFTTFETENCRFYAQVALFIRFFYIQDMNSNNSKKLMVDRQKNGDEMMRWRIAPDIFSTETLMLVSHFEGGEVDIQGCKRSTNLGSTQWLITV